MAELTVTRLLSETIDTFEKLQVAIHLFHAGTGSQSSETIAEAVSLNRDAVEDVLAELARAQIAKCSPGADKQWAFDPDGPWAADVATLSEQYDKDPFEIVKLMGRLAVARIRSQAARLLTDPVLVRSKPKKGDPDT